MLVVEVKNNTLWGFLSLLLLLLLGFYLTQREHLLTAIGVASPLRQQYEQFRQEPDVTVVSLLRTLNPMVKNAQGRLLWNTERQEGMLYMVNLPVPSTGQFYQVWIYDARSEVPRPISAGVLQNVKAGQAVYFPLIPETTVAEPYKFVLTLEETLDIIPERILLMAQP